MDEELYQAIIPGLPDDLALRCLTKISHGYHGLLECVSKRWREAMKSLDYANLKASEGWCGNWLFVSTSVEGRDLWEWDAYDPDADRWHPLPRMPRDNYDGRHYGFSCVSICKRFMMIGGCYVSCDIHKRLALNMVLLFDPFKKQWSRMACMHTARTDFACAVICGKVYVAGGGSACGTEGLAAAEVYDPCVDRWEDMPPMPFPLIECFSVSYGGQFHVVGRKEINVVHDSYVIFNTVKQRWHVVEDIWPFSKLARFATTTVNDRIYTITEDGAIEVIDMDRRELSALGVFPSVFLPYHIRPLKPFAFGFVGFRQSLYAVGGLTLKYDSNTHRYGVVKLSSTRFCDPAKLPLEWNDVRPMPSQAGGVVGCGFLEE